METTNGDQVQMSEIDDESHAKAREEIAKLRSENSELIEEMLVYTGLPGQMHRMGTRIEQLKSLANRAADALESASSGTHFQLIQELRNAAQSTNAT